ncbi:hypothetical protein RBB73_12870 [Tunturiibacter empetritectus]|uniref:Uncharacterized protein n=2 Tax=Tunturiibacter empetritectus TaxID=3069691 RepID=A0A7W8ILU4_9BACT|nr:hypothetical protein [Edaphobacter lichenicola]
MHKHNIWKRQQVAVPFYLSHLLLTCMVVNDLAEELRDLGDFRKRLTAVMGGGRHNNLYALRVLWQKLELWTSSQELLGGKQVNRLILPDIPESGRYSQIGYSLRLSVPSRRDQDALRSLLSDLDCYGRELEVQKVLKAIAGSFGKFSPEFQDLYTAFTLSRKHLPDSALIQSTFWNLVRAVSLSGGSKSEIENNPKLRLELEDEDGHFWLTLCSDRPFSGASLRTIPSSKSESGAYPYIVNCGNGESPLASCLDLILGLDEPLTREALEPICKSIAAGFLLFEEEDDRLSVQAKTLPTAGRLKALLSQTPNQDLRLALRNSNLSHQTSRSIYQGWTEWREISAEALRGKEVRLYPSLAAVDCLRPVLSPVRVVIRDGVRIGSSYLAVQSCLPTFHVDGSDRCELQFSDGSSKDLVRDQEDDGWLLGAVIESPSLIGTQRVCAYQMGLIIAERLVSFVEGSFSTQYRPPIDKDRWLVESLEVDLITAAAATKLQNVNPASLAKIGHDTGIRTSVTCCQPSTQYLVLELASLLESRRGIPEGKLIKLFESRLQISGPQVWAVIRSWVEAGYLEVLTDARWRARVYFGNVPRLAFRKQGGGLCTSLTGLVPLHVSNRFEEYCGSGGFLVNAKSSSSSYVPPMLECIVPDIETVELITTELGLDRPTLIQPSSYSGPTIRELATSRPPATDDNWLYLKNWDWTNRYFRDPARLTELNQISLSWCRREDGPDRFKVFRDGELLLWTRSRVWAVLSAYALAGLSPFEEEGNDSVICSGGNIYLPLPLARSIGLNGPQLSGPIDGRSSYRYVLPTHRVRQGILAALGFATPSLSPIGRVEEERLNLLLRGRGGPKQFVPEPLRRQLLDLTGLDERRVGGLVSQSALPELYAFARTLAERNNN